MYVIVIVVPFLNMLYLMLASYNPRITINTILINNLISFLVSMLIFYEVVLSGQICLIQGPLWISSSVFQVNLGFLFDALSTVLVMLVSFISLLVQIYSREYMSSDPHIIRFFGYLNLFTFFMLILVTADNFLQMFFGWEGVGLASYLLINFWFKRTAANKASIKAMLVNRVGDMFLILSLACIFNICKSLDYAVVFSLAHKIHNTYSFFLIFEIESITLITALMFLGIMAKSSQIGLHTWLTDAMEGPTPVSALIHAATMVTAGVFLLIRCSPLFEYSTTTLAIVAITGGLTAVFGALSAAFQNDIKKIIAYSTTSQLGFMVSICGLSHYQAALAHLFNHAFFKALLFLTAGYMIHLLQDEQDINRTGRFAVYLPFGYICMLIGSLSLIGMPFLTGYYSKHLIIELAAVSFSVPGLFVCWMLLLATFLTSFYSTKILLRVYWMKNNSYKQYFENWHFSWEIVFTLTCLSLASIFFGYVFSEMLSENTNIWNNSIVSHNATHGFEAEFLPRKVVFMPLILSILGFILVFVLHSSKFIFLYYQKKYKMMRYFFQEGFFFNQLYNNFIVNNVLYFSYNIYKFIDKGLLNLPLEQIVDQFSKYIVSFQSGSLYHYFTMAISSTVYFMLILYWPAVLIIVVLTTLILVILIYVPKLVLPNFYNKVVRLFFK